MEKINILIVSDPSRKEESDIENAYNAFKKYLVDDVKPCLRGISGHNRIAWALYDKYVENFGTLPEMYIFVMDYTSNEEVIKNTDVLILLPSLDRSGFCEAIENKWLKIKGNVNIEVM